MTEKEYDHIIVSIKNKKRLNTIGKMGDSYNDVIEYILNKWESEQKWKRVIVVRKKQNHGE